MGIAPFYNVIFRLKGTTQLVEPAVPESMDDDMLMLRVANGDTAMLGELYLRYRKMVHSALRRFAPAMPEAQIEEQGQDVFMLLAQKAKKYEAKGIFKAYVYGIAAKKARTWQRNHFIRSRILGQSSEDLRPIHLTVENCPAEQTAMRESIIQMMRRLPEKQRIVLLLHSVEGFNSDEISEILGVRPQTVRSRLFRARQTLMENVNCNDWTQSLQRDNQ